MSTPIVAPPRRRSVITKDLCTYTTIILREEKSLRDHGAGTAVPAVSGGVLKVEQALGRIDDEDAPGDVHLGPDRLDERNKDVLGPRASRAGRARRAGRADRIDGEDVLPVVEHIGHRPHHGAVHRAHGEADEVAVAELV